MTTTPTPNGAEQAPEQTVDQAMKEALKQSMDTRGPHAKSAAAKPAAAKAPLPKLPGVKARTARPAPARDGAAPGARPGKAASAQAAPAKPLGGKPAAGKPGPGPEMRGKVMPGKPMPGTSMTMPSAVAGGAMADTAKAGGLVAGGTVAGRMAAGGMPAGGAPVVTLGGKPAAPPRTAAPKPDDGARRAGRLGKLDPQFPAAVKSLHYYITQPLPPAPASVDYAKAVVEGFPMDGNDEYGDCTMAAAAHLIQAWNAETGIRMPVPTEPDVVAQYLKLSGGQDTGLVESQVLQGWLSTGLWDNKIVAYAPVNVHSLDSIKQAVAYFGGVYVGVQVPENAKTQFERRHPWALEEGWQGRRIEGGHAIPILGYDDQYMYCVTWGAVHPMSWDWWSVYGDEAWVVLSQEFDQAGKFNGIDVAALRADIAAR